jgi:hypothetical protein
MAIVKVSNVDVFALTSNTEVGKILGLQLQCVEVLIVQGFDAVFFES